LKRAVTYLRDQMFRRAVIYQADSERGQALAEYALILALIAVVCVTALGAFGVALRDYVAWRLFDAI
jgi:Flp pilus assembly pilin Flp